MAYPRNLCYLDEGDGQLGFYIGQSIRKFLTVTTGADNKPTLPVIEEVATAMNSHKTWQENQPQFREWKRLDNDAGRQAARPERREAYRRAQFIEDPTATRRQNDTAHLHHERQEDEREREAEDKALLSRCNKKIAEILRSPPTTLEGIRMHITGTFLPAFEYIHKRCSEQPGNNHAGDRYNAFKFFESALLLNPNHCRTLSINQLYQLAQELSLSHPKLNEASFRDGLRAEMSSLKISCTHEFISDKKKYDFLKFHFKYRKERPFCYLVAKVVAISQPSSAAVERVFSLYRNLFSDRQGSMLSDARTFAMQLAYHDRSC